MKSERKDFINFFNFFKFNFFINNFYKKLLIKINNNFLQKNLSFIFINNLKMLISKKKKVIITQNLLLFYLLFLNYL